MRTETDAFKEHEEYNDSDSIYADSGMDITGEFTVGVEIVESGSSSVVRLTKQQAAKFARQILEMCGEGEPLNSNQAGNGLD